MKVISTFLQHRLFAIRCGRHAEFLVELRQRALADLEVTMKQYQMELEILQTTDPAVRAKKLADLKGKLEELAHSSADNSKNLSKSVNELRAKYITLNTSLAAALSHYVTMTPGEGPFKGLKGSAIAADFCGATGSLSWRDAETNKIVLNGIIRLVAPRTAMPANATEKLDGKYSYTKLGSRGVMVFLKSSDVIFNFAKEELMTPENILAASKTLINLAELDKFELKPAASVGPVPKPLPPTVVPPAKPATPAAKPATPAAKPGAIPAPAEKK